MFVGLMHSDLHLFIQFTWLFFFSFKCFFLIARWFIKVARSKYFFSFSILFFQHFLIKLFLLLISVIQPFQFLGFLRFVNKGFNSEMIGLNYCFNFKIFRLRYFLVFPLIWIIEFKPQFNPMKNRGLKLFQKLFDLEHQHNP